jgi:hypothetical protein
LSHKITSLWLSKTDGDILRIVGGGSVSAGVRELVVIYRDLWALGYRPTVPVKLFVRRYKRKKKAPIKGPEGSSDGAPV